MIQERHISTRITEARTNAGLTKNQLAEAIGRHSRTVHRIESGDTTPSIPLLESIATACGVTVHDLIPDHSQALQTA
eukprot:g20816.t1